MARAIQNKTGPNDKTGPNVFAITQAGPLEFEAIIFAATFRAADPDFSGRLIFGEPQPGPLWVSDPRISTPVRDLLTSLGAEILPFENRHFGQSYPHGNKIEGLACLPANQPFIFFDTDTLFTGPLSDAKIDFARPSASMRRTGTWPQPELYGPGYAGIWKSLYDKFGLEFAPTLDLSQPDEHWERYLYFNAGWFFHDDPAAFGQRFTEYALAIRDDAPDALACQELDPWLDQVALPLVIHSLSGGRPGPDLAGLDGDISCHYRMLGLLYARENDRVIEALETAVAPNKIKKVLKNWDAAKRLIYQGKGATLRQLFDRDDLPVREQALRNAIKREGLWLR